MRATAAVVHDKGGPFLIESVDIQQPERDELLVKVVATGICHTDVNSRDQFYPMPFPAVLGHEGAGIVETVGPNVRTIRPGDHVVMSFGYCGQCPSCRDGQISYCWHHMEMNFSGRRYSGKAWDVPSPICLEVDDGPKEPISGSYFCQSSFATYAICSERNAVAVRSDIPLQSIAPLGCSLQTGAGAILNTLKPRKGASILVTGAGTVGLAAIMAAKYVECGAIVAVDLHPGRLALARELGATVTLNPKDGPVVDQIRALFRDGVEYAIETTGNPAVFREAVDMLQVRGVCGLIGGAKLGTEASLEMTHVLFGRTIRGILQGDSEPKTFIPRLIELYKAGVFPIDRLVRYYPFLDINDAIADMKSGATIKPVLVMT